MGGEAPKGKRGLASKGEDPSQDILEASKRIFNQQQPQPVGLRSRRAIPTFDVFQ